MADKTQLDDPCGACSPDSNKDLKAKEDRCVVDPLRRFEITDLPKPGPVVKVVLPDVVEKLVGKSEPASRSTEGQTIILLLIVVLIVAAFGAGVILTAHAMRA